jgi:hypothetical protein
VSDCDQAHLDNVNLREASGKKVRIRDQYHRDYYHENKKKRIESRREYDRAYYSANKAAKVSYHREYKNRREEKMKEYFRDYDRNVRNKDTKRDFHLRNKERIINNRREHYYSQKDINSLPEANKSWKSPELIREYFESIKGTLLIANHTDWYRISRAQLAKLGGVGS